MKTLARHLPILDWGRTYDRSLLGSDLLAAAIVTIMLIPQSLAYAMLAGLPPEMGLYAAMLPLVAYGLLGTSRTLAVGPVAVVSLMTASAVGEIAAQGSPDYVAAAVVLALLSGGMMILMGLFRLGFLANFLSHPVISGFIAAAALLIAGGQIGPLLGIAGGGSTLPAIASTLAAGLGAVNPVTLAIGAGTLGFLLWARAGLGSLTAALGLPDRAGHVLARTAPILAVAFTIALAAGLDLGGKGVALVGAIPKGLPPLGIPAVPIELVTALIVPALLISLVGFVESASVAQTLAARRRQRIRPDQELIGLGAANLAAGVSSGYPVTGGFARSVVNFDAGAQTPAAGIFTAAGIALAALFLTPLLAHLPQATLAATIVVAVLSIVDFRALRRISAYSRIDAAAMAATILATLVLGVEPGIAAGVLTSLVLHLYRTSRPHTAIVGQVPGTEHFRNIERHAVATRPDILSVRVDESLYFANSRYLEDRIAAMVAERPELRHVILMCPAVNAIDASGLESLKEINHRLAESGIAFHLSEVKGPVMDRLLRTDFLETLSGRVFLTQHEAVGTLAGRHPQAAQE